MCALNDFNDFHAHVVEGLRVLTRSTVEFDFGSFIDAAADTEEGVGTLTLPVEPECQPIKSHHMICGAAHAHACQRKHKSDKSSAACFTNPFVFLKQRFYSQTEK